MFLEENESRLKSRIDGSLEQNPPGVVVCAMGMGAVRWM